MDVKLQEQSHLHSSVAEACGASTGSEIREKAVRFTSVDHGVSTTGSGTLKIVKVESEDWGLSGTQGSSVDPGPSFIEPVSALPPVPAMKCKIDFHHTETDSLICGVTQHYQLLFGAEASKKSSTRSLEAWELIQKSVNSLGISTRSIEDLKHKWQELQKVIKKRVINNKAAMEATGVCLGENVTVSRIEKLVASSLAQSSNEGRVKDRKATSDMINKQGHWDATSLPVEPSKTRDSNKRPLVDFSPPAPLKYFCSSDHSFNLRKSQQGSFAPLPYRPNSQGGSNAMDYGLSSFSGVTRQMTPVDRKEVNGINFNANPSTSAEATEFLPSSACAAEEVSPRSSPLVFEDMPSTQQGQHQYSGADSKGNLSGLAQIAGEWLRHVRMEHERNERHRANMLKEWRSFREVVDHRLIRSNDLMQGMAASLHSLQRPLQLAAEYEQDWQAFGRNAPSEERGTHSRRSMRCRGGRNRARGRARIVKSHYKTKQ
uniref:uncharacterized protein n=1 Tax=Myxine glutinosa TaxID=7769 RepID=UPI00358EE418